MNGSSEFNPVDKVRLVQEKFGEIKRLDGFQKTHAVPKSVSDRDTKFLCDITQGELDADLEETFAALRSSFGFKRREIAVSGPEEGYGAIETPFFNYEISIQQQEDEPARYCLKRSITEIRDPNEAFGDTFQTVFGERFCVLEILAENALDIEGIVDRVEDAESDSISVDYDKHVSWCKIKVDAVIVEVSGNTIRIVSERKIGPRELLDSFLAVQREFISMLEMSDGWFAGQT